jgi:pentatricopeptide repeat protein
VRAALPCCRGTRQQIRGPPLDNLANQVSASEIGQLVDRIAESPGFRRSSRLQRFLRYVTEYAVNSPGQPLKEIQVAIAVFDKDANFDPRLDPIVRVEAGRFRLRLLEYYAGAGAEEAIFIEIPLGRYLPNFRLVQPARPPDVGNNEDPVSRSFYLKGRYFWGKRTAAGLAKAAEYFCRALAINSGYARAYLGLADCYAILGTFGFAPPREAYPRAKASATAALTIDPQLAEAHTTLATLSALYEWDRDAAGAGFRRVIDMRSGYAFAHQMYGVSLLAWQRSEEGLAALKTAEQLEPLAPLIETQLAAGLYVTGKNAEAEEACRAALELEPDFWPAHYFQGLICEQECRYQEAVRELGKAVELSEGNPQTIGSLAHVYASAGERSEACQLFEELESRRCRGDYVPPFVMALVRTGFFDKDAAFEALEKAFHERSPYLGLWLTTEPRLEFLRSDRRFVDLVARTRLPAG